MVGHGRHVVDVERFAKSLRGEVEPLAFLRQQPLQVDREGANVLAVRHRGRVVVTGRRASLGAAIGRVEITAIPGMARANEVQFGPQRSGAGFHDRAFRIREGVEHVVAPQFHRDVPRRPR